MAIPDSSFGPFYTQGGSSLPHFGGRGPVWGGETGESQQRMGHTVSAGYQGAPLSFSGGGGGGRLLFLLLCHYSLLPYKLSLCVRTQPLPVPEKPF